MKAVIYARVSSKDQEETGYSLPAQVKLLKEYAYKKRLSVVKVYSISESASGQKQREMFKEMLEYIRKNNIKNIVCEKVDRLTRNLKDAVDIDEWINKEAERNVHFVKENVVLSLESKANEKFIWNIKVSVAQYYINNLSEEVKKGQLEMLDQGQLPAPAKIGYQTVGEKGHKTHIPKKPEATHIAKMFDLYATGQYSTRGLPDVMAEQGLRSRTGQALHKSDIHRILCDPYYYGMIRWKGRLYPGKHEAIIEKNTYDTVQAFLRRKNGPKYARHNPTFKGMLRCGGCGGTITWEIQKGHWYGHCNGYRQCDQKTYVRQEKLEEQIISDLTLYQRLTPRFIEWLRKALKESHAAKIHEHNEAIEDLTRRRENVQQRLDRIYDEHLDGKIDDKYYKRRKNEYELERESLLDAINRHDQADKAYFELGSTLLDLAKNSEKIYNRNDEVEKKRHLLSIVFSNLVLDRERAVCTAKKPFQILADAAKSRNGSRGRTRTDNLVVTCNPLFS